MILWDWAAVILPHDEAGSGPAVVLIHAGIADRTMWSEHVERLADAGYRAVAVDLPGFGEARVASGEQAPWAAVLRTMDGLSIARAALVGSSFGGAVALRAALVAPDRVSALALISGSTARAGAFSRAEGRLGSGGSGTAARRHRGRRRGRRPRVDTARRVAGAA